MPKGMKKIWTKKKERKKERKKEMNMRLKREKILWIKRETKEEEEEEEEEEQQQQQQLQQFIKSIKKTNWSIACCVRLRMFLTPQARPVHS